MRRVLVLLALCVLLIGCARTIILLDKPDYHYQNGLRFLNEGNPLGARAEFEYAASLNATYVPAYVGLAVTWATLGDLDKATASMKKAQELLRKPPEQKPEQKP